MGQKSSYLERAQLGHALGATIWTPPVTLYALVSLAAYDPDAANLNEPTGVGSYARVVITNNTTNFPAPASGNPATLSNGTDWAFPLPTADWGTVLAVYLADAATAGNILYGTAVTGAGVPVVIGQQFTVNAGDFLVRET